MTQPGTSNLWRLLEVIACRRRFVVATVLSVTILALIVSLLLPKYYRATALLLPPKEITVPIAGQGRLAEVVSVTQGLNLPVMVTTSDVYARMLASRRIVEPVIREHLSLEKLGARNMDEAMKKFLAIAEFAVTPEGLLELSFEDRQPELAAAVVNSLVAQLDQVNRDIAGSRARQNRVFIQDRLGQVQRELDSSRADLRTFQDRNRTVDFDEQIRLATEQAIELKIKLSETDLNLQLMADKYTEDNPDFQEWQRKRNALLDQVEELENRNTDSSYFSLPIASIPALRGEYEQLYTRVRVNEGLYQTLLGQLEMAKIQENEELPTITVLDAAEPPGLKSRPKRAYVVLTAFAASLVISVILAAFFEYLKRLSTTQPDDYRRAVLFLGTYFGWLPAVKRMKQAL
jgi:uncharacterized protein involved in exopolysaccharide biosynthesis